MVGGLGIRSRCQMPLAACMPADCRSPIEAAKDALDAQKAAAGWQL